MTTWVSPQLLEACNGILVAVLAIMMAGMLTYLFMEWREIGFWNVYRQRKAGIALTVFLVGLICRSGIVWLNLHRRTHGLDLLWPSTSPLLLTLGTAIVVVGGICWVRVTAWRELGHWFWIVAATAAVAFGVGFAL